jgi:hypothetical protein
MNAGYLDRSYSHEFKSCLVGQEIYFLPHPFPAY